MIGFEEAIRIAAERGARLIAIDGLPASGKSTLADAMSSALGAQCVRLDDFVLPEREWRGRAEAGFPFPYVDCPEFVDAVRVLSRGEPLCYAAFDWETGERSDGRCVGSAVPIIVEGVSVLRPDLAPLYDLRFWVESDARTTLEAALRRGVGDWAAEWRDLFMPSVSIYLATTPAARADFRVAGRMA